MVCWIVNDLSLNGQYGSARDFLEDFRTLLNAGQAVKNAGHSLCCERYLRFRPVSTANDTIESAIHHLPPGGPKYLALNWLTKGPFWEPPPEGQGVVYRLVADGTQEDVTEQGLGQAAKRRWLGQDARTFSFRGLPQFERPFLDVLCLRETAETEETSSVPNDWDTAALQGAVPAPKPLSGWAGMLRKACSMLKGLYIAEEQILKEMSQYPFGDGVADRLYTVLAYLNEYAEARDKYGEGSEEVKLWYQTYVYNHAAVFSSQDFDDAGDATFYDPLTKKNIPCPWHGKVHNPMQFRIHYEYPVPAGQRLIKVLYIGDHR